ncbi:MAG: L,D-transpeptidase family protein, partial [Kiritimatiellae bacterium]|nr:L,D-transpeptidase family protein [Kiritimatiellia bacterium]
AAPQRPARQVPASASPAVRKLVEAGQEAEMRDDLSAARAAYAEALASTDVGDARGLVESRLGEVMVKLVSTQREMPEKVEHAIVAGDRISILAKRHGTTVDLISMANRISNPNNIKLGDRLRILDKAKFEIEVSKSENWLLLKMNGKFFKRYTVGTGLYNRTPVGTFKVSDKIKEPDWWKDNVKIPYGDPRNILGTRWMAISATGTTPPAKGYGIHGTWDNSSLGQQSSAGCVRMANTDVEELFTIIPEGTAVTIHE